MFRLCRYLPGGHFAPHFDGPYVQDQNVRSLQTFMLYLNGDFEGGSTNFVDKKQTLNKVSIYLLHSLIFVQHRIRFISVSFVFEF